MMNKISVSIAYFTDEGKDKKDIELTQTELIGLMLSNKMGSEGDYYKIEDKIFEDTEDGYSVTVTLVNENENRHNKK